jgi:O-antigen/teichoic acid export membrane protein
MASQTKKITLDTAALFFGRAVGLLLGMVRLNYLATFLGVANFGILNFATYFTALFQSLFDLGMSQLMTREIARNPSRSTELLGRAIILKVIIVLVASILVGVATVVSGFDRTTNWAVLLTTAALAINGISQMFLSAFQAHRKMVTVSVANIANDAIVSGLIIFILPIFPSVSTALILTIAVSLINLGILVGIYYGGIGRPRYDFNLKAGLQMLKEGSQIAFSTLGISIYTFIGATVLKYSRGEIEVGLYSAGYKLISILTLIPVTFTQVIYPIFSDFFEHAKHKLEKALTDSLRVVNAISTPIAVGAVILAPKIFSLLYTEQFAPGTIVFQVAIVGNIFGYMDWVLASFLLATNRQVFLAIASLSVALGALVASLLAVPASGFVSLPFIQAGTEVSLFIVQIVYVARLGYHSFRPVLLLRPMGAALVMGIVLSLFISQHLLLLIPIGGITYFLVLYWLGGMGEQEMTIFGRVLSFLGPRKQ